MIAAAPATVRHPRMITRRIALATFATAATPAAWAQDSFAAFIQGVKADARRQGVRDETLTQAFAGVVPNQRVIELDRRQPEFNLTWPQYRARVLPDSRLQAARRHYAEELPLLRQVEQRYGVDTGTMVGVWGIESAFGVNKGNYRLTEALTTLAWEGRRATYFRKELLNALKILDAGDVSVARLTGGYAGAMGQPQFMPSSYLQYAVDFDGDGRRDIWDSKPDVFGSMGNYLARNGWRRGEPWGQPVRVPGGLASGGRDDKRPLGDWMRAGVMREDGRRFSRTDISAGLVLPDGAVPGEGYLVYANFMALRRYNPSDFYALAVGLLGDAATGCSGGC